MKTRLHWTRRGVVVAGLVGALLGVPIGQQAADAATHRHAIVVERNHKTLRLPDADPCRRGGMRMVCLDRAEWHDVAGTRVARVLPRWRYAWINVGRTTYLVRQTGEVRAR